MCSYLPSTPAATQEYTPITSIPPQKASQLILALVASASTERGRIAAMKTVPSLLAEEKTRLGLAAEAAQLAKKT